MMGASHAISGAAVWVAITTPAAGFGILSVDPIERIAGAIVCAGAALLPDADHPNATIAYSVPGGSLVTGAIGKATGGHRKGMHSLLAVVGVLAAAIALSHVTFTPDGWDVTIQVGAGIMAAACIAFAVKVMHLARSWLVAWLTGIVAAGITSWFFPSHTWWLPVCLTVGYFVHLLGDFLTVGGVPWLWPIMPKPSKTVREHPIWKQLWRPFGGFALPLLGKTGSWREQLLTVAMTVYAGWGTTVGFFAL
ncbi:metal-dependent hydrolase [Microbacterium sp.]|uniref:metal-dependent hydrolase n=1 Tax=Microbacterium sp. TaxID=51671 RepID=UPI003F998784